MADAAKAELRRALGQLVRGLATLFWALPLTAIAYVETAEKGWWEVLGPLAFAPALGLSVVVCHGLNLLGAFQKQERIWQKALHLALVLAMVDAGLAPFLFWWHLFPFVPLYAACTSLLFVSSLFLLIQINCVLQRLCAMLPDETLRSETKMFTNFNITLLLTVFGGLAVFLAVERLDALPALAEQWLERRGDMGIWMTLFLILMPLAMTMALIWKIKEVIFAGLIEADR